MFCHAPGSSDNKYTMTRTNENSVLTSTMIEDIQEEKENIPLCTYCRKSFANYSNLRHHIQIVHLKESKWDCIKCGKVKYSKNNNNKSQIIRFSF